MGRGLFARRLMPVALLFLSLSACISGAQLEKNLQAVDGFMEPGPSVPDLALEPRSYESHYNRALALLHQKNRTDFELHLARVGFETAARLSRDYWPAWFYAGMVHDMLGNYEQAMNAFVQAASITDNEALWNAAALAALRGNYEQLAYSLHRRGNDARVKSSDTISLYMKAAYEAGDPARPHTNVPPLNEVLEGVEEFICRAPQKKNDDDEDDEGDDDDGSGYNLSGLELDFSFIDKDGEERPATAEEAGRLSAKCEQQNVIVDAYIIRRNGESTSSAGIDLLSALQIQFGAQLLDFTYTNPSGGNNSTWTATSSATIEIPDVTYALSIANDRRSYVTIDASPSIVARLGETSQIFDGTEVYIVATGEGGSGDFEKEIGVKMSIEPHILTGSAVTMTAGIEFSTLEAEGAAGNNFRSLNTDKLIFDINGTFPFGAAVLIGKLSSSVVKDGESGQSGLRSVPGVRHLFGNETASASRRDVLVLAIVRQPATPGAALQEKVEMLHKRFGVLPLETGVTRYGFIHEAPPLAMLAGELGFRHSQTARSPES